ncbi:hypothetical protein BDA99DRAFT_601503 [Phascolomyces articulosus]|uniref:Uncharacterized protein n=1 Tax=Phascolomyces articulosus TaxID=60185 RepID=A0AAD5K7Z4_9FUNG|nr:hypothetical protein BDA99DRAFT_601503 [Phascolomyces articulosus]
MVCALIFIVMALVIILPHYVYAYCFYNKMSDSTEVTVLQKMGITLFEYVHHPFNHNNMPPGSKECYPYTSEHCSYEPNPDNKCGFDVGQKEV